MRGRVVETAVADAGDWGGGHRGAMAGAYFPRSSRTMANPSDVGHHLQRALLAPASRWGGVVAAGFPGGAGSGRTRPPG